MVTLNLNFKDICVIIYSEKDSVLIPCYRAKSNKNNCFIVHQLIFFYKMDSRILPKKLEISLFLYF